MYIGIVSRQSNVNTHTILKNTWYRKMITKLTEI